MKSREITVVQVSICVCFKTEYTTACLNAHRNDPVQRNGDTENKREKRSTKSLRNDVGRIYNTSGWAGFKLALNTSLLQKERWRAGAQVEIDW